MNEKRSYTEYLVVGTPQAQFAIGFEDYQADKDMLKLTVDNKDITEAGYTVDRNVGNTLTFTPAVPVGSTVRIQRVTDIDAPFYIFTAGNTFAPSNVDANFKQLLHAQQEVRDGFVKLQDDVVPLVVGLPEALEKAQEAAEAAQAAAESAADAATDVQRTNKVVESIAELRLYEPPQTYSLVTTRAYRVGGLVGGSEFVWDSTSVEPDNNGSIIKVATIATGRWKSTQYVLNPYQFGAYGDLVFGTGEVLKYASGYDDTKAFKDMLNVNKYVIHTNISKAISSSLYVKHTFRVPTASYYITDTLPVRTFTHIEWCNSTVHFNPSTPKNFLSTPRDEMAAAYTINTGWNTQTISMVRMSDLVLIGNLTRTSTNHNLTGIDGGNAYKWHLSNMTIERFQTGIALYGVDTSAWTGGSRKGNFYENLLDGIAIHECVTGLANTSNALQCTNLTIGGGYVVGRQYTNKFDYLLTNTGAGASFNGFNIAPASDQELTKALIYDACHGSYYGGGYSEWFNILFDLECPARFDGFKFDASHLFKRPTDTCIRFVNKSFNTFNIATGTRTPSRHFENGRQFNNYLNHTGFEFGAGGTLITNFFKFCSQYDFKYGLYGAYVSNIDLVYDVKRFESVYSGFTTGNGIRLINNSNSAMDIVLPCANQILGAKVCMLYRPISGTFKHDSLKSNAYVNASNDRISIGELMYDYGNGWFMAACEVTAEYSSYGNVTLTIPANSQVEIEHIGAYTGGVPIMPTYADYVPTVNTFSTEWLDAGYNITGGTFAANDLTRAAPSVGVTLESDCYITSGGRVHPTRYTAGGNNNLTASATNVIDLSPVSVMRRVGSGNVINITQSGITLPYTVVGRVFENGVFTSKVKVSHPTSTLNAGSVLTAASYNVPPVARGATNYTRKSSGYTKTVPANAVVSTDIPLDSAYMGATVSVGVSPPLGGDSLVWVEVISPALIRLYHRNFTSNPVTVTGAILSIKIV